MDVRPHTHEYTRTRASSKHLTELNFYHLISAYVSHRGNEIDGGLSRLRGKENPIELSANHYGMLDKLYTHSLSHPTIKWCVMFTGNWPKQLWKVNIDFHYSDDGGKGGGGERLDQRI